MSKSLVSFTMLVWTAALATASNSSPPSLVTRVDLTKYSRDFDHLAADVQGNRLFRAAEDHGALEVLDLNATKWLKTVTGCDTAHRMLYLPVLQKLFVTDDGDSMPKALGAADLQVAQKVTLVRAADSPAHDPPPSHWVTGGKAEYMKESVMSVIDTTDFRKKAAGVLRSRQSPGFRPVYPVVYAIISLMELP